MRTHRDVHTAKEYAAWTTRRFFMSVLLLAVCWPFSGWLKARAADEEVDRTEHWRTEIWFPKRDGSIIYVRRHHKSLRSTHERAATIFWQFDERSAGPGTRLGLAHGGTVERQLAIQRRFDRGTFITLNELKSLDERVLTDKFPPQALEMYRAGATQSEEFSPAGTAWMLLEGGSRLLFWFAIALCASRFWLVLRRFDREIGDRCVRCNYSRRDLQNKPCPECGLIEHERHIQ